MTKTSIIGSIISAVSLMFETRLPNNLSTMFELNDVSTVLYPISLINRPRIIVDRIGPTDASPSSPSPSSSLLLLRIAQNPTPKDRIKGTDRAPVVTAPASKARSVNVCGIKTIATNTIEYTMHKSLAYDNLKTIFIMPMENVTPTPIDTVAIKIRGLVREVVFLTCVPSTARSGSAKVIIKPMAKQISMTGNNLL